MMWTWIEVRIMIPFTMCCLTCKEFSYRGKKFNSKKEIAQVYLVCLSKDT